MKTIIEAVNFTPTLELQDFIMKKVELLSYNVTQIELIKIELCNINNEYYCSIVATFESEKLEVALMDADVSFAILHSIAYLRKTLKKNKKNSTILKNHLNLRYLNYGIMQFDFSVN